MSQEPNRNAPQADPSMRDLRFALMQSRVTMTLLIVLLVGLVIVFITATTAKPAMPIEVQAVLDEAKARLHANREAIYREATSLIAETGPPIAASFVHQAREDLPVYARALESQSDELVAGLESQLRLRVRQQIDEFLAKHRQVFREEFPKITDEATVDRILRDYRRTANRLLDRYYLNDFRRESKRTVQLWKSFEPVKPPLEGTLQDELLEYVGDWLALQAKTEATQTLLPR